MPRGASGKREHEYQELKEKFHKSGRYEGREEQVAARIVNKQRRRFGETAAQKTRARQGKAPDQNLPITQYQHLTIPEIRRQVGSLSKSDQKKILAWEQKHKNRKGVVELLRRSAA